MPAQRPSAENTWPSLLVLAAGTVAIYAGTFTVPLLLDDTSSIAENASIHGLASALAPPNEAGVGGRSLLNFSYALNYAAGGTSVFGYHLVNLIIHVLAAMVLFALVRITLRRPGLAERFGAAATPLALAVSAIWAWHPLQTEAVTYLSQRAEALMGLFYLLTLYGFARGAGTDDGKKRARWFTVSVLACLAGVATKEVIATAPLMVLLYDRTFFSGSFAAAWQRHRTFYWALAATWLPLGALIIGLHERGVGFGQGVSAAAYALAECRVVIKYLLLVVWPDPLIFDYGSFVAPTVSQLWPYILALVALVSTTIVALRRMPAVGFALGWFLLVLAPTSSVVPIAGQPMAESRVYLALAGIAALVGVAAFARFGRWSLAGVGVVAVALGFTAARRNRDYASVESIWRDTVEKNPTSARAHNNLGEVWLKAPGRSAEARAQFDEALRLQPDFAEARGNLGNAEMKTPGRLTDAIAQYEAAARLQPRQPDAHNNLGNALLQVPARRDEAIAHLKEALRLRPDFAEAHDNLGNAWAKTPGRLDEAIAEYQTALRLKPEFAEARFNLGSVFAQMPGRANEAIAQYEEALRLNPALAEAHIALATALIDQPGRANDASAHLDTALRLQPDNALAHFTAGNLALQTGRLNDAIAQYQEAVRLAPDLAEAHFNLGNAWFGTPGHAAEAIAEYQTTLRLKPDYAEAHFNLANAWAQTPGRLNEAIAQYEAALRAKPEYAEAHFNLAVALLKTGSRNAEAATQLESFLRIQPENQAVRQLLGRIRTAQR